MRFGSVKNSSAHRFAAAMAVALGGHGGRTDSFFEAFEIEQIVGIPAGIYVYGTRIYDLVHWDRRFIPRRWPEHGLFAGFVSVGVCLSELSHSRESPRCAAAA